jgi:hypothetical protein
MTTRYITTPIYYVNDRPHIGHCYTTLLADALTRAERLRQGSSVQSATAVPGVFFLTGTDEHADKVVTSAAAHGMSAIAWADRNAAEFARAFEIMACQFDDFIRTTQDRHKTRVTEYVTALIKSGAIYKGSYEGWYDENQEEYLTETVAKDQEYKSKVTGKPLVRRTEPCYFFRLSAYASSRPIRNSCSPRRVATKSWDDCAMGSMMCRFRGPSPMIPRRSLAFACQAMSSIGYTSGSTRSSTTSAWLTPTSAEVSGPPACISSQRTSCGSTR